MRSVRRSQQDNPEVDADGERSEALSHENSLLREEKCSTQESEVSLWFGDFVLAMGCFAVITAAGQLPLTAPRLFEAISSVRIATAAKRSAPQRETRAANGSKKLRGEDAADSTVHLPAIITLN